MADPRLFFCNASGMARGAWAGAERLEIGAAGGSINFDHEAFFRRIGSSIQDRLIDLVEIAAFVYAADARISRGGVTEPQQGASWRRRFVMRIGVRDASFWSSAPVREALTSMLVFVSEDDFAFDFVSGSGLAPRQSHFALACEAPVRLDEIIMFSGGLDSLAGAVSACGEGCRPGLVSIATSSKISPVQRDLAKALGKRYPGRPPELFQIGLNLKKRFGREDTHRTRAFLFSALGAAVAISLGKRRLNFFENGVLSLNLPIAAAVVGARATRTTHPQTLFDLSRLFSLVTGDNFEVRNPFFFLTKTDVVRRLQEGGAADLIRYSRSCAHVRQSSQYTPHCGRCSQCIDRRFAILAAGLADQDPAEAYAVDLLTGHRPAGRDRVLALAYYDFARKARDMTTCDLLVQFPEVARALALLGCPEAEAVRRLHELHHRHGEQIVSVMSAAARQHAEDLVMRRLDAGSLLVMSVGSEAGAGDDVPARRLPESATNVGMIMIAFGSHKGHPTVWVAGVGLLKGVGVEVMRALRAPHEQDIAAGRMPENFAFVPSVTLVRDLGLDSEEVLRRRIKRLRDNFDKLMGQAGFPAPDISDLIESQPRQGYRINPTRVRIVSWSEVEGAELLTD